jgi:two-component system, probable response regulator PhcQ
MSPDKILYVDDEPMALKYFERLVSPLAPVITALSVEQGKALLLERGGEIAVLVTDQRMPGAYGNELLRYTREYHPRIVRMLTTAYSELGEAIEAINSGEIYRYITKPWEMAALHADLRNALELAELRNERDQLINEKLFVQQQQLLGSRLASLVVLGVAVSPAQNSAATNAAMNRFAQTALLIGCKAPQASWHQWDQAGLLQAEARRSIALAQVLSRWQSGFAGERSTERALRLLADALDGVVQGNAVSLPVHAALTDLLTAPPGQAPQEQASAWLAWLLWWSAPVMLEQAGDTWQLTLSRPDSTDDAQPLPADWLESAIERLTER